MMDRQDQVVEHRHLQAPEHQSRRSFVRASREPA
jgi:hypothetical protein